jgi:TRAP-type C4-dicarboxylate transport system permease small subunit
VRGRARRDLCQTEITVTRWRWVASSLCGWIAAGFLTAIMLLTVADVVLRAAFNLPIRGVYDLVELLLAFTFFMALPAVFLRDQHILVNVIDDLAPRVVPVFKRTAEVLAIPVFALLVWQAWLAAVDSYEFHDVTGDLGLPRTLHWSAVLIGLIGAMLAAIVMAGRRNGSR